MPLNLEYFKLKLKIKSKEKLAKGMESKIYNQLNESLFPK